MSETFTLPIYTGKETGTFRQMTLAEVLALTYATSHIWFKARDGSARQVKVNGKVKRWKRQPERFELPTKYGLYEYHTFSNSDLSNLLVRVG